MNTIQEKLQSLKPELESLPYLRKCRVGERKVWTKEDNELFAKKRHRERQEELIKYFGVPLICHFCGEEVCKLNGTDRDSLVFHSLDENHDNWDPENKTPSHFGCHIRYHVSGRKLTLETKMKLRKLALGRIMTPETRMKMSKAKLGKKFTLEARMKMSKAKLGKKFTLEARMKMSKAKLGEKHWRWQGDKASKKAKDQREYRARKKREGSLRACNIF